MALYGRNQSTTTAATTISFESLDLNIREGCEGYTLLRQLEPPVGYTMLLENHPSHPLNRSSMTKATTATNQQHRGGGGGSSSLTPLITPTTIPRPVLTVAQQNALKAKQQSKAFSIAMQPGQQLLMNAFMMYMSGSQLNVFSISVTSMSILTPLTALFQAWAGGGSFSPFGALQNVDITIPRLLYTAIHLAWLGVGLYKMSSMRLLPTTSADFVYKIGWKEMLETSSIPPPL